MQILFPYYLSVLSLPVIAYKLLGKLPALVVAVLAITSPWLFSLGRSGSGEALALSVFLAAWAVVLCLPGIRFDRLFIPVIILPALCFLAVRMLMLGFPHSLRTPNLPMVSSAVNEERKNSIHFRGDTVFSNKFTVFMTDSVRRWYAPYDTDFLFVDGSMRGTSSRQGVPYLPMVLVFPALIGFCTLFVAKPHIWMNLSVIGLIAPLPYVLMNNADGNPAYSAVLLLPVLFLFTGYGIKSCLDAIFRFRGFAAAARRVL